MYIILKAAHSSPDVNKLKSIVTIGSFAFFRLHLLRQQLPTNFVAIPLTSLLTCLSLIASDQDGCPVEEQGQIVKFTFPHYNDHPRRASAAATVAASS